MVAVSADTLRDVAVLATTPVVGGAVFLLVAALAQLAETAVRGKKRPAPGQKSVPELMAALCAAGACAFMISACVEILSELVAELLPPLLVADADLSVTSMVSGLAANVASLDARTWLALGCVAVGWLLVWAAERLIEDRGFVVVLAMFLHTASEGAGIAVLTGSAASEALTSIAAHNLFEGAVVASATQGKGKKPSWAARIKTLLSPCVSHAPQWIALLAFRLTGAADSNPTVTIATQGFAIGSMVATIALELVPEAVHELGYTVTLTVVGSAMWLMSG
jgi:zinc transporter ZupT